MVADYQDSSKGAGSRTKGSTCFAAPRGLAGPGRVAVGEEEHGTANVVIATGSDAVIPPIPGLAEAEGVWTNREVTALTDVPERMVVLGGGPVGVEMSQAVHRMGASVALVEGMDHLCRASRSRWARRSAKPSARRASSCASDSTRRRCGSTTASTCSSSRSATSCAGTGCWSRPGAGPAPTVSDSTPSGSSPAARDRGRHADVGRRGRAIGDVTGIWPLTYVGKYQGASPRRTSSGARRRPTTTPSRAWCSPTPRPPRSGTQRGRCRRRSRSPRCPGRRPTRGSTPRAPAS